MSPVASYALAGAAGQATDTSYEIKKGLRFNYSDTSYLSKTIPDKTTNATISFWFKRSVLGVWQYLFSQYDGSTYTALGLDPSDQFSVYNGAHSYTTDVFRDPSAWYHACLKINDGSGTFYINNKQVKTQTGLFLGGGLCKIGDFTSGSYGFSGYISDFQAVGGSGLPPTVFGEYDTNGVWQPKEVTEAAINTAKESQQPYDTRDNMDQEWSGGTATGGAMYSGGGWDQAFLGQITSSNYAQSQGGNSTLTFTNSIPFTTLRFAGGGTSNIKLNGILQPTISSGDAYTLIDAVGVTSPLQSVTINDVNHTLSAIEIDGRLLADGPADNSQLWSATALRSDWGSLVPPENLFDGSLSTYTYASGSSYRQITWDAITASTSVEVYGRGTTDSWRMIIDGSPVSVVFSGNTVSDNSWRTVSTSFPCSVTGIENNNPGACYAVRIDGKILINAPSQYNASNNWSKYLTSAGGFASSRGRDQAFMGTDDTDFTSTPANVSGESNAIEFTPPTTLAYSTLEVRGRGTDQTTFSVKIDTGSGYGSAITSTGDKWQTIATSGTLTKLKLWTTSVSGENELGGIRINGKALVDGGWGINGFHLPLDDGTDIGKDTAATAPALDPRGGFDAVTYTGNGGFQQISGLRFEPDFVWIKERSAAGHNRLTDSVRGASKHLISNLTDAEYTNTNSLVSFNSDGFSLEDGDDVNDSGQTYVAWAWKAGGVSGTWVKDGTSYATAAAAGLTGITSPASLVSASINTTYGFSVIRWNRGADYPTWSTGVIPHGLTQTPKMIITKNLGAGHGWMVFHASKGVGRLYLNDTGTGDTSGYTTLPTSSVFTVDSTSDLDSSDDNISYCWSEVAGFSKFGSYTGNGSSSGPAVTTGFKPKFILMKRTDSAGDNWVIFDAERNAFDERIYPNSNSAGATGITAYSVNANGFTVSTSDSTWNASGGTYIYAAFADYPANNFTPHNLITEENTSAKNNFGTALYTGNGGTQAITGLDFQPDLVWIKDRTLSSDHALFDSVRGVTKRLRSNQTNSEDTDSGYLTSFNSDGFTVGSHGAANYNNSSFVAWAWKAGGTASSNTDGSITSSVSANPNFGFSIVSYTSNNTAGATVGHGLNASPKFIIFKNRDASLNWLVYHDSLNITSGEAINLSDTAAAYTSNAAFNSTLATSSVFTLGQDGNASYVSGQDFIAYCWSEVPGYSRFSSYVGNGSSTGPVIDCGFAPAFLLIKADIAGEDWTMHDSKRGSQNIFFANTSAAEMSSSAYDVEFTGTGFQIKNTNPRFNTSGSTYIFAAFAEPTYGDLDLVNDTPSANAEDPVKGNYCTLNAVDENSCTFSNGNLGVTVGSNSNCRGTVWPSSGKWYFEFDITSYGNPYVGIASHGANLDSYTSDNSIAINNAGDLYVRTAGTLAYPGKSVQLNATGSYMCAFDLDNGKIWWGKDGTWYAYDASTANTTTTVGQVEAGNNAYDFSSHANFGKEWTVAIGTSSNSSAYTFNAGQQPFKYTPPSGYKRLCTTNLPDPTIEDPRKHFDAKLWSGNSASTRSISGYEFSPDFLWIKQRNQTYSVGYLLYDIVRGVGSLKNLDSVNNTAEGGGNTNLYGYVSSLDSNGFSVAEGSAGSSDYVNLTNATYVAWSWDAGSSSTTNTDGSLTSTVRANTTAGFSIVGWTGNRAAATVGHGLNAAPEFLIVKNRDTTGNWMVYHKDLANANAFLNLNSSGQPGSASSVWNGTAPTSTVFSIAADSESNGDGDDMIAYCFTSVAGYSQIGSYEGNGTADNAFVYTGFKPKFVLFRNTSTHGGDWMLLDTERRPNGPTGGTLVANVANAEDGYYNSNQVDFDFLSNGFKIRHTGSPGGDSGRTYIYLAIAENPFKTSRAY